MAAPTGNLHQERSLSHIDSRSRASFLSNLQSDGRCHDSHSPSDSLHINIKGCLLKDPREKSQKIKRNNPIESTVTLSSR